jgi:PIN domain nuclease of toxin-antitoxin system
VTNLLLDTHVLIWWLEKSPRLGSRIHKILMNPTTRPMVSAASLWEIAIKAGSNRLESADQLDEWVPRLERDWGVRPLAITFEHAVAVARLPRHHRDPFDRILVAQAQCEGLTIVTVDPAITAYEVRTIDASV